ncbi:MAG: hypothetical protein ABI571_02645 [Actinomycetota bacterium]
MSDEDIQRLTKQVRDELALIKRAERALAEIDRTQGITNEQADVLAALRIRIEGKERAKLEDLLSAAGDISGTKDLGDVLGGEKNSGSTSWPEVEEKKRDWPGA